jgi:putative membrane protein
VLGIERTCLAYERTMMAWVRTATSLISFGFTIYKFFQYLRDNNAGARPERAFGPTRFAMLMVSVGIVSLVFATWNHHRSLRRLRERYGTDYVPRSPAALLAGLMGVVGVVVLVMVIRHY